VASSAWLQLILFGLRNCGQSVFNFPLSSRPEVESEGLPFPAPKKHPLLVWIWGPLAATSAQEPGQQQNRGAGAGSGAES